MTKGKEPDDPKVAVKGEEDIDLSDKPDGGEENDQQELIDKLIPFLKEQRRISEEVQDAEDTLEIQSLYTVIIAKIIENEKVGPDEYTWSHWWDDCLDYSQPLELAYQTDEKENAIDCIEKSAQALRQGGKHRWKHFIVNIHGAMYGLAITAMGSSNSQWVTYYNRRTKQRELISFPAVIKRLKGGGGPLCGKVLSLTVDEDEAINKLNEYRNQFNHFEPKGWSIMLDGMPLFCMKLLNPLLNIAFGFFPTGGMHQVVRINLAVREIAIRLLLEHANIYKGNIYSRSE